MLVIGVLLLSTAADILPNDTIVGVGEVQLNLARLLAIVAVGAFVATQGLRLEHWRTGLALPLILSATGDTAGLAVGVTGGRADQCQPASTIRPRRSSSACNFCPTS